MLIFRTKQVILLILTIFFFNIVKAQSDFRSGHIITRENDTINGLIKFKKNRESVTICTFKKGVDSNIVSYSPIQIKSYQFTDGKY